MEIERQLVKKVARFPKFCTNCDKQIVVGDICHVEEGVNEHIHSLIARQFCTDCYTKYGEKKLIHGMERIKRP